MAVIEDDVDNFLAHYGVLGMKWGVRKDRRVKTKAAKRKIKEAKFQSQARKLDLSISQLKAERDAIPKSFIHHFKKKRLASDIDFQEDLRDTALKDAKAVRDGKMTSTQKTILTGSIIAGVVTAVAVGTTVVALKSSSGELNALKLKGEQFVNGSDSIFHRNHEFVMPKTADEVFEKVVQGVNPAYKETGGRMNCRRATFAYELRRRGFNVAATPSSLGAGQTETGLRNALLKEGRNKNHYTSIMEMVTRGKGLMGTPVEDGRSVSATRRIIKLANSDTGAVTAEAMLSALKGQPNGARGEVLFKFSTFGHSMAYEIFEGKPVIFDSQKATKYALDSKGLADLYDKWTTSREVVLTRLDDVDLDLDFLARWATNIKDAV